MPDTVALASVISSGLVAVGGLWVSYRSGRDQRLHEARLSYEERAWEKKSEGLYAAISTARGIVDVLRSARPAERNRIALTLPASRHRLDELVPIIEAYSSTECRDAFDRLRQILRDADTDILLPDRVAAVRARKEEAIDAQDFESAANFHRQERDLMRAAADRLGVDFDEVLRRAERLIQAARASVRGEA